MHAAHDTRKHAHQNESVVQAITPARLNAVRAAGADGHGNRLRPFAATGPVYIHAVQCGGYAQTGRLPEQLATGPRVLRTYRGDGTMNYDHNTVVTDQVQLEPIIERLLSQSDVATVHVRTLAPRCFLYVVTSS